MTVYDSNPTPPTTPLGGYTTDAPADTRPMANGDRWGLIAVTIAVMTLLSCVPGGTCLAPLVAGIVALTQVKNAVDPSKVRTYGWIATGVGIAVILIGLVAIVGYGAFIASLMEQVQNNPDLYAPPE
ncbi:MAG TPA: hypothetical protein VFS21_35765 [Roseiflexaceae bacterium]|nr:hypothetical protein [Roseiflexaceae bacterium]